jgi:hypothetical protein
MQTIARDIVLRDTYLLHPSASGYALKLSRIKAPASIVIVEPRSRRPQASTKLDALIELLATTSLTVMCHLQVVAVKVLGIFRSKQLIARLNAQIA